MLERLGTHFRNFSSVDPWTNAYGLARTLLATCTLLTFLFNSSTGLFREAVGINKMPPCDGIGSASLFCQVPGDELWIGRIAAIVILLVVASGWYPRITGVLHWWVSFSFNTSSILVDGGDQITAVLTLLLLPITLTDDRRWHWSTRSTEKMGASTWEMSKRFLAMSAWIIIRIQVAGIYLHAAIGKMAIDEWANGTALYYWFTHPSFGVANWLEPVVMPLVSNGIIVSLLTWSVILFELTLFTGLVMAKHWWRKLMIAGVLFHAGIAVFHGLITFMFAMLGALVLFLHPIYVPFDLPEVEGSVERIRAALRTEETGTLDLPEVPKTA
ncbi:MAG: sporulation-delaying protein SdpB family protein [Salinivenus sp.]